MIHQSDDIKVSVLITTYNHAQYISQALESVLFQTVNFNYEIILGEDDSSDGTREICIDYAKRYPSRIRLFLHDRKDVHYIDGRATGRRNFINNLQQAKGKYVALLDGDDFWIAADKLQKQVDILDANPQFSICFHNALVMYDDPKKNPHSNCSSNQKDISTLEDLIYGNFIPTCSAMHRNEQIGKLPDWYWHIPVGDWPLHILSAERGNIFYIDEVLSIHRRHSGSIWHSRDLAWQWLEILKVNKILYTHFCGNDYFKQILRGTSIRYCEKLVDGYRDNGNPALADDFNARIELITNGEFERALHNLPVAITATSPPIQSQTSDSINQTYPSTLATSETSSNDRERSQLYFTIRSLISGLSQTENLSEGADVSVAKLYVDTGKGITDSDSLTIVEPQASGTLEFDVSAFQNINKLIFAPIKNNPVILKINKAVMILKSGDMVNITCQPEGLRYKDIDFDYFINNNPSYLIDVVDPIVLENASKLVIEATYVYVGIEDVTRYISEMCFTYLSSKSRVAMLYVESEDESTDAEPVIIFEPQNKGRLEFDISNFKNISGLTFAPIKENPVIMKLVNAAVLLKSGELVNVSCQPEGISYRDRDTDFFIHNNPGYRIVPSDNRLLSNAYKVIIEAVYEHAGTEDVTKFLSEACFEYLTHKSRIAVLYIDIGNGLNEQDTVKCPIDEGQTIIEFDLKRFKGITLLRFDPLAHPVIVSVKRMDLELENGITVEVGYCAANADITLGNYNLFSHNESIFELFLNQQLLPLNANKLTIYLDYMDFGSDTVLNRLVQNISK